jgi:hypothetical protein
MEQPRMMFSAQHVIVAGALAKKADTIPSSALSAAVRLHTHCLIFSTPA